jgi:glycosyltransferase involved in cell wall biosynthesis
MPPFISAVVNTLNEERNVAFALRSLRPWVDEIVVVDMASDDATVEVARSFGARVVGHERTGFVGPAREVACAAARGEWLMVLDADELVPEPLSQRLREVARQNAADAVRMSRLNHLLGGPLLHSGWNPKRERHVRFFRRGAVQLETRLHEPPRPRPGTRVIELPDDPELSLVHFNYLDTTHFLFKLNDYAGIEAEQTARRGERLSAGRALGRALREALARYVWHAGWRDGWRGLSLSLFMAAYHVAVYAKLRERDDLGSRADAERRYREEAERLLAAYAPHEARIEELGVSLSTRVP